MAKAPLVMTTKSAQWSSVALNRLMTDLKRSPGMKMTRLDRRHTGHDCFDYQIHLDVEQFVQVRNWCWETFGPSYELNIVKSNDPPAWCWRSVGYNAIYLRGDEQATLFQLKWA